MEISDERRALLDDMYQELHNDVIELKNIGVDAYKEKAKAENNIINNDCDMYDKYVLTID